MQQGQGRIFSNDIADSTEVTNALKAKYKDNYNQLGLNSYIRNIKGCQTGEEGVQLKIFQDIGIIGNKGYCVDFGAGDGIYLSSTRMLREDLGFDSLLMDGAITNTGHAGSFTNGLVKSEFITAENINSLFQKYEVPKEFDYLSVDIDGNEFYVTREILKQYKPNVIQCETNPHIRPDLAVTLPYNDKWVFHPHNMYYGASLAAITNLVNYYGYSLVCTCEFNAIYLRNELVDKLTVEIPDINNVEKMYKCNAISFPNWIDTLNREWVWITDDMIKQ
jgi:hypothetical protein